jgi:hypothetical protein
MATWANSGLVKTIEIVKMIMVTFFFIAFGFNEYKYSWNT